MAEWLRRLTRKPKVRTAVGSNPALDSLVAVRNSCPGQPEPCEGSLVAAVGSCGGLMVTHPWPLLEISLSDFRRLATLNIYTFLPTYPIKDPLFTKILLDFRPIFCPIVADFCKFFQSWEGCNPSLLVSYPYVHNRYKCIQHQKPAV